MTFFFGLDGAIYAKKAHSQYHIVAKGDHLTKISLRYGVSISDLISLNKIKSLDHIYPGQKLIISARPSISPDQEIKTPRFGRPFSAMRIIRRFQPNGENPNYGLLLNISPGTVVKAAESGKVLKIDYMRGYGRYILVDHGSGWLSMYSHLKNIQVKKGQKIKKTNKLGQTSRSKVYFVVAYNGKPVNPGLFW